MKKLIFYFFIFGVALLFSIKFRVDYSYSSFKDYSEVLLNVSGMVFTLMGIWVALLYPNALTKIVDEKKVIVADFSDAKQDTKRLEFLVSSILKSALIVICLMVVFLSKIVFSEAGFYGDYKFYVKSFVLSFVFTLSVVQAEAVLHVMLANIMFINDLHKRREDREADKDI